MGNCVNPMTRSGAPHELHKPEETKPLAISALHHQVALDICTNPKKVRFDVQTDNAAAEATVTGPNRMKRGMRVKVVLTQSELKQILNRATIYHHHQPPRRPSSVDRISGRIMVNYCKRSRRSALVYGCRSNWNPALQTIPEWPHY